MAQTHITVLLALTAFAVWQYQPFSQPGAGETVAAVNGHSQHFSLCSEAPVRDNCVIDGDTFWLAGEKVRIAGIDTPETHPPRCAYEEELGRQATYRLRALLNEGPIHLRPIDRDRDVYGRLLRNVEGARGDVGERLVGEGLARPYGSGRRSWC